MWYLCGVKLKFTTEYKKFHRVLKLFLPFPFDVILRQFALLDDKKTREDDKTGMKKRVHFD